MNREIKFRAWDKISKQMFKVYSIEFRENGVWVCLDWKSKVTGLRENWLSPDRLELMQYTGLKDKNGVEIYEGDICLGIHYEDFDTGIGIDVLSMNGEPFEVKWDDNVQGWSLYGWDEYKVVGNIYQNKDLLN